MDSHPPIYYLIWIILYVGIGGITIRKSRKEERKVKELKRDARLKLYGRLVYYICMTSYAVLIMYAIYWLSIEHDIYLFIWRMAIYGIGISCIVEMMLYIGTRLTDASRKNILLIAADTEKKALWYMYLFRFMGPICGVLYVIAYICKAFLRY